MSNTNASNNVDFKVVDTYKMADSQTIDALDPMIISSGKVAQYNTIGIVPNTCIGLAMETKNMLVISEVGQQEYISIIKKGKIYIKALKDSGSYTGDIVVGTSVSLYCDGNGNYYAVNNSTNPIGTVIEGNVDAVTTTTYVVIDMDLTIESVKPSEIGYPLLIPTTKKIQFYSSGNYIQGESNGQIKICADGGNADSIHISGSVTIDNDLVVTGTFSGTSEGQTWTGDIQLNNNKVFNFEGVADDSDGLTIDCDASGDASIVCTAGQIDVSTKDGIVKFVDSDAATDYITITTIAASSRQIIAAEPSGLFRFKDAGDANSSDVLDLDLTDAASANKLTSAVGFEIETTAGHITLDAKGDIYLDPEGNDIIFGVSAGQFTLAAASTTLYGGDTGGDDLIFRANSSDADPKLSLLGGAGFEALILDQDFQFQYDGSNYLKIELANDGHVSLTSVGTDADFSIVSGTTGDINLSATGDIVMTATGADITMDSQLTITNTSSDQLVIAYSGTEYFKVDIDSDGSTTFETVSAGAVAHIELATDSGGGDITLDAAGDIVLEAGGDDINADAPINITHTGGAQLELIESGAIKTTFQVAATSGAMTVTTAGGNANHFEIATGTAGNITLDSAGTIVFEPGTHITHTLAAAGIETINATAHTAGQALFVDVDINSASCDAIKVDLEVSTGLSSAEVANGLHIDFVGKADDNAEAFVNGITLTGATTSAGTTTGIKFGGAVDTGIDLSGCTTTKDIVLENGEAINNSANGYVDTDGAFRISGVGGAGTASALTFAYSATAAAAGAATIANAPIAGAAAVWIDVWYGTTKYHIPLFASS